MSLDARAWLDGEATGRLQEIVRQVLGEPGATLGAWEITPLLGGMGAFNAARALCLVQGTAQMDGTEQPWSVVLKGFAPVAERHDPAHFDYWKREWLLYDSGFLDALPPGLSAPRCYGTDRTDDGARWLWLEYVREEGERRWSPAHWVRAARGLGRFNGAYAAGRPLPRVPWLGGQRLRTWVERHEPLVARIAVAPDNPAVAHWWPRPVVAEILRLWAERDRFYAALEQLPQAFGHGDAIRRNLLARRGASGEEEIVGIDWEFAGQYAVGEEIGQTLSVASAFFDVDPHDLPALDEALFASYLGGLRDAGWRGDPRPVRFACAAHAALRNGFNAVGASVPSEAQRAMALQNYGHTGEALAERRAAVRPFLLARADEARALLATL